MSNETRTASDPGRLRHALDPAERLLDRVNLAELLRNRPVRLQDRRVVSSVVCTAQATLEHATHRELVKTPSEVDEGNE